MLQDGSAQRRYWIAAGTITLIAAIVLLLVAPRMLESAYHGRSFALLNGMMSGRRAHGVEFYLAAWRKLALLALAVWITGSVVVFAGIRWIVPFTRARMTSLGEASGVGATLLTALALGAMAGAVEILAVSVRHVLLRPPVDRFYAERLWLAPIGAALEFGLLALLFWLVARPLRATVLPVIVAFATELACYGATASLHLGLYPVAAVVLAAGAGLAAGRITHAHAARAKLFIRRGGAVVMAATLVLALGMTGLARLREWWLLRSLPEARPGAPNVLLLILDTVRAESLDLYGFTLPTSPRIDQLARSGVTFDHAFAPSSWTLPSHASMVTGRLPSEHHAGVRQPMSRRYPTIGEVLEAHGYETAAFLANSAWLEPSAGLTRGFITYKVDELNLAALLSSSWIGTRMAGLLPEQRGTPYENNRKTADMVNGEALAWMDSRAAGRPFFLMLNYFDAHAAYPAPTAFRRKLGIRRFLQGNQHDGWHSPTELQSLHNAYAASLAYLDDRVGQLLDELSRRGALQNTVVILTSDHGDLFGEHDAKVVGHGRNLDYALVHVPLVVAMPGRIPGGVRISAPVSLRALPSTILDLLELPGSPFPTRSLAQLWVPPDNDTLDPVLVQLLETAYPQVEDTSRVFRATLPMAALVKGDYQYVRYKDGEEQLVDYPKDPFSRQNLLCLTEGMSLIPRLRADLQRMQAPNLTGGLVPVAISGANATACDSGTGQGPNKT